MPQMHPKGPNNERVRKRNKATVLRVLEAFNDKNAGIIDDLTHPDIADHTPPPGVAPGRPGLKKQVTMLKDGFPDARFEAESIIAEGDMVFLRWRMTGTHKGKYFFGSAPTNKKVNHVGHEIVRLKDGKIVEHIDTADPMVFMDKLGLLDDKMMSLMKRVGVRDYA